MIYSAKKMNEGKGAIVKRLFPTKNIPELDPFLLLDEFSVDPESGFPLHSHQGVEFITYMLEGSLKHKDSTGASGNIKQGDVQVTTAGKGIKHEEMPSSDKKAKGIQLWTKLEPGKENTNPGYQKIEEEKLPKKENKDKKIITLVGQNSPVNIHSNIGLYHIILENSKHTYDLKKEQNTFIYVIEGSIEINNSKIEEGTAKIIKKEDKEIEIKSKNKSSVIIGSGKEF